MRACTRLFLAIKNIKLGDGDEEVGQNILLAWRKCTLAALAQVAAKFGDYQPSAILWRARKECLWRIGFVSMLLARARLQALAWGDMDEYRDICKRQVYVRMEFETRSFALAMHEWVATYHYNIAGEDRGGNNGGKHQDGSGVGDQNNDGSSAVAEVPSA
jgi:hypothetical protein